MPQPDPAPSNSSSYHDGDIPAFVDYPHLPLFASFPENTLSKKTVIINGERVCDLQVLSKPTKPKPAGNVTTLPNRERVPWTEREDNLLRSAVQLYGERTEKWAKIAMCVPGRTNKKCRKRWFHSLDPTLRKGAWTDNEDNALRMAVFKFPGQWSKIAETIPGRTDDQCAKRWRESLDPDIERSEWRQKEDELLMSKYKELGSQWQQIAMFFPGRPGLHCRNRWRKLSRSSSGRESLKRKSTKTDDNHFETTCRSDAAESYHADAAVSNVAAQPDKLQHSLNNQNLRQIHPQYHSMPSEHHPERDIVQLGQQHVHTQPQSSSSFTYGSPTDMQPSYANHSPRPDGFVPYTTTNTVDNEVSQTTLHRNPSHHSFQLPQFHSSYPPSPAFLPPISSKDSGQYFCQLGHCAGGDNIHQSHLVYHPHNSPVLVSSYSNCYFPNDTSYQQPGRHYAQQPYNRTPYINMGNGEAPLANPKGYYSHQQPITPLQTPTMENSSLLSQQQRWNEPTIPSQEKYHAHYITHQHPGPDRQQPHNGSFVLIDDHPNGHTYCNRDVDTIDLQTQPTNWPTPQPDESRSPYQDTSWTRSESHNSGTNIDALALTATALIATPALDNDTTTDLFQSAHLPFTPPSASSTNTTPNAVDTTKTIGPLETASEYACDAYVPPHGGLFYHVKLEQADPDFAKPYGCAERYNGLDYHGPGHGRT